MIQSVFYRLHTLDHMNFNNFPYGLKVAQDFFREGGWQRKKMTACYISGNIMKVCTNSFKTSSKSTALGNRIHAEHNCLKNVPTKEGKLYVYRETFQGTLGMARPCDSCMKLILNNKIRIIYYTTPNGFAKEYI